MSFHQKKRSGQTYVDRGAASGFDLAQGSMTMDNSWNDWDVSSVVPAAAAGQLVHVVMRIGDDAANNLKLRQNGSTDAGFATPVVSCDAGDSFGSVDAFVLCDSSRIIEYKVASTATTCDIVIRGWWING